jgi:hypothetical protein
MIYSVMMPFCEKEEEEEGNESAVACLLAVL